MPFENCNTVTPKQREQTKDASFSMPSANGVDKVNAVTAFETFREKKIFSRRVFENRNVRSVSLHRDSESESLPRSHRKIARARRRKNSKAAGQTTQF